MQAHLHRKYLKPVPDIVGSLPVRAMQLYLPNEENIDQFEEKFDKALIKSVLEKYLASYDVNDDANGWFNKVKAITEEIGFTTDMKAYKADPTAFPGTVADVSTMLRIAITGKQNSPDLYTVTRILGQARMTERVNAAIAAL